MFGLFKIEYFLLYLLNSLSYIIPKKKGYWVFLPARFQSQFSGNLKYFFLYIHQVNKKIHPLWVTSNEDVFLQLEQCSLPVKKYKVLPFWQILFAEYIFIENKHIYLSGGNFRFIQLWHGTGFKNIVNLRSEWKSNSFKKKDQLQRHLSQYILVLATSYSEKIRREEAFASRNVVITGSPRNDIFFDERLNRSEYKEKMGLDQFSKVILYAPTFREDGVFTPFSSSFWERLNEWASSSNSIFIVKKHLNENNLSIPNTLSHIRDLTSQVSDVQELLVVTDLLVSDYSSIVTDFVLTRRPVIFYFFDYEEYQKNSRTFYYDLHATFPGPFAYNESDLLEMIMDLSWFQAQSYQEKYTSFINTFHMYNDGNSSSRLLQKILEIGNNDEE